MWYLEDTRTRTCTHAHTHTHPPHPHWGESQSTNRHQLCVCVCLRACACACERLTWGHRPKQLPLHPEGHFLSAIRPTTGLFIDGFPGPSAEQGQIASLSQGMTTASSNSSALSVSGLIPSPLSSRPSLLAFPLQVNLY